MEEGELRGNTMEAVNFGGREDEQSREAEVGGVATQKSPSGSPACGNSLHGENTQSPRAVGNNDEGKKVEVAGGVPLEDGTGNNFGQNGPLITPGPRAHFPLGKRNRDQRSPPSVGSMQGPNIRVRHVEETSEERSFDLNRSSSNKDNSSADCLISRQATQTNQPDTGVHSSSPTDGLIPSPDTQIDVEIGATVAIGNVVGVNLHGFEDEMREAINCNNCH
ncbi:hypothetical protein HanPI659440_Chr02g0080901 [Helianthus annuus]|nr:hypothetical protein HanPI659440_Chr02g0080901 [Helianthus annuus]